MKYGILKSAEKWLLRSIQLQLYLTLVSGPILIYWGLPVSVASPIGNILFHPLLTVFLFLSSLIFFCQILHLPKGIFVYALGKTSHAFHYLLALGTPQWLIGFAKPSVWVLIAVPIATGLVFCCKKTRTPYRSIGLLLLLLILFGTYLKYSCLPQPITTITCNRGHITLLCAHNQTILIDPGVLGSRVSAPSWVEFTLVPTMIKMTGQTTITNLIALQPSQLTFDAIRALCQTCIVKTVYMPLWQGEMTKGQKHAYAQYMEALKSNNTNIVRIGHDIAIPVGLESLKITQQPDIIKSKDMSYHAWQISGVIQGNALNIFSHKLHKFQKCLQEEE